LNRKNLTDLPLTYCWFITRVLTTSAGVPSTADVRPEHTLKYRIITIRKLDETIFHTPPVFSVPRQLTSFGMRKLK